MPSENGWNPAKASVEQCQWVKIPGAEHVSLQLLKGQPLVVLRAFAADFNAYVEPLRDADSAGWTATNSVPTSNHLNGTAMDLNWQGPDGKKFRLGISFAEAYPGDKQQKLRDLLTWYEDVVYCGGFWSIRDWMHFQMGYNTFQNPRTADFIRRKIRADGFSTYKRGSSTPQAGGGDLTPEQDKMLREIHGALFNSIPSQSKYRKAGEGARWKLHELIKNDDAMLHEMLVEQQALLGNPEAVDLVKREADKGDKWAQVVYDYITEEADDF